MNFHKFCIFYAHTQLSMYTSIEPLLLLPIQNNRQISPSITMGWKEEERTDTKPPLSP